MDEQKNIFDFLSKSQNSKIGEQDVRKLRRMSIEELDSIMNIKIKDNSKSKNNYTNKSNTIFSNNIPIKNKLRLIKSLSRTNPNQNESSYININDKENCNFVTNLNDNYSCKVSANNNSDNINDNFSFAPNNSFLSPLLNDSSSNTPNFYRSNLKSNSFFENSLNRYNSTKNFLISSKSTQEYIKSLQMRIATLRKENLECKKAFDKLNNNVKEEINKCFKEKEPQYIELVHKKYKEQIEIIVNNNKKLSEENNGLRNYINENKIKISSLEEKNKKNLEEINKENSDLKKKINNLQEQIEYIKEKYFLCQKEKKNINQKYLELQLKISGNFFQPFNEVSQNMGNINKINANFNRFATAYYSTNNTNNNSNINTKSSKTDRINFRDILLKDVIKKKIRNKAKNKNKKKMSHSLSCSMLPVNDGINDANDNITGSGSSCNNENFNIRNKEKVRNKKSHSKKKDNISPICTIKKKSIKKKVNNHNNKINKGKESYRCPSMDDEVFNENDSKMEETEEEYEDTADEILTNKTELENIENEILIIQSEIQKSKNEYQRLVDSLEIAFSPEEKNNIKENIMLIEEGIKDKNIKLLELRTQQQEILKQYLSK